MKWFYILLKNCYLGTYLHIVQVRLVLLLPSIQHNDDKIHHSNQPLFVQALQKLQINIDKTPPKINLQPPRIRLDRIRGGTRQLEQILLVRAHDQERVLAEPDAIREHFRKRPHSQSGLLVHAPFGKRHVLGDEFPLPGAPLAVVKRHAVALLEADDERVEVGRGPEPQECEPGGGIVRSEGASRGEQLGKWRGFLELRVKGDFVDHHTEVDV